MVEGEKISRFKVLEFIEARREGVAGQAYRIVKQLYLFFSLLKFDSYKKVQQFRVKSVILVSRHSFECENFGSKHFKCS